MLVVILFLLIILTSLGYLDIPGIVIPNATLLVIAGRAIKLLDILVFFVIIWAVEMLPGVLRHIGWALVVLWVLSTVGIIAIEGLAMYLVAALILGIFVSIFIK